MGSAGSGKSTAIENVTNLVDPAGSGRRTTGLRVEDLAAAAQHQGVIAIDNAGRLDKVTSDALCIMVTGGTLYQRKMYEQGGVSALDMHRSVVISAVSPVCVQPDLQSRVIRLELRPRPQGTYHSEASIRAVMTAARPRLLGALYTLFSAALRDLPEVCKREGWPHRLVSFDQLGEAALIAAEYPPDSFLKIVGRMRERLARRTASGDVFVLKLVELLRTLAAGAKVTGQPTLRAVCDTKPPLALWDCGDGRVEVTARPSALRTRMPIVSGWDRDATLPTSDRAFLDALRRVQPMLTAMGITYTEAMYGSRALARLEFDPQELDHD